MLPYKIKKRKYLTRVQKQKRLDRAKILLRDLKSGTTEQDIVFSDEKLRTIKPCVHNQNDRVYAESSAVINESVKTV